MCFVSWTGIGASFGEKSFIFFMNSSKYVVSHRMELLLALISKGYDIHVLAKNTGAVEQLNQAGITFHDWQGGQESRHFQQFGKPDTDNYSD